MNFFVGLVHRIDSKIFVCARVCLLYIPYFPHAPTCTACDLLWRHVPKNFLSATGGTLEQLQSGITMSSDNRIDSFLGHELRVARSLYRRHVTEWVSLWNIWQVFKVEFCWDSDDRIGSNFISWHRVCLLYIPKAQFCQLPVYKWKNFRVHPLFLDGSDSLGTHKALLGLSEQAVFGRNPTCQPPPPRSCDLTTSTPLAVTLPPSPRIAWL